MRTPDLVARRAAERRGRRSELIAGALLMAKGYRILGRRVRTRFGEIDLVARAPSGLLCFVEVKARQLEQVALDSVRLRQQLRIAQAAQAYLSQRPDLIARGVRFDIVTFGGSLLPRHLPGAFHPEDWRRRDA